MRFVPTIVSSLSSSASPSSSSSAPASSDSSSSAEPDECCGFSGGRDGPVDGPVDDSIVCTCVSIESTGASSDDVSTPASASSTLLSSSSSLDAGVVRLKDTFECGVEEEPVEDVEGDVLAVVVVSSGGSESTGSVSSDESTSSDESAASSESVGSIVLINKELAVVSRDDDDEDREEADVRDEYDRTLGVVKAMVRQNKQQAITVNFMIRLESTESNRKSRHERKGMKFKLNSQR